MGRYTLKAIYLFLILFVFVVNASAGTYRHPKTGVFFPEAVGDVRLIDTKDYEKENPGLGVGIMYRTNTFKADFFLYDMGNPSIPSGVASPVITAQFEQARGDVYTLRQRGIYKDVITRPLMPAAFLSFTPR